MILSSASVEIPASWRSLAESPSGLNGDASSRNVVRAMAARSASLILAAVDCSGLALS